MASIKSVCNYFIKSWSETTESAALSMNGFLYGSVTALQISRDPPTMKWIILVTHIVLAVLVHIMGMFYPIEGNKNKRILQVFEFLKKFEEKNNSLVKGLKNQREKDIQELEHVEEFCNKYLNS